MELHTRRIRVSLAFPPDTDTPMLAAENLQKPRITKLLSAATATVPPEAIAASVIRGMEHWRFFISTGFDGWMLSTVTAGMAPASTLATALVQAATMGLWRLIGLVYIQMFYGIVAKNDERGRDWFTPDKAGSPAESSAAATGTVAAAAVVASLPSSDSAVLHAAAPSVVASAAAAAAGDGLSATTPAGASSGGDSASTALRQRLLT